MAMKKDGEKGRLAKVMKNVKAGMREGVDEVISQNTKSKPKMKAASPGLKKALGVDSLQAGKKYPFTKEAIARRDSSSASKSKPAAIKSKPKMKAASPGLKKALGVDSLQSGKFYPYTKEALAKKNKSSK